MQVNEHPIIHLIGGARPNFMKLAPLVRAIGARGGAIGCRIVHTGQHYDADMSEVFFEELGIPAPHHHLGCGGGSHAEQTARIMVAYEKLCLEEKPDAVVVVGDVNSTLACSIVAKKLWIPVAHVEAGLRSGDMTMPEEINRIVTDSICDWFFVTEPAGVAHLVREGKRPEQIHFVGHVMVDNLLYQRAKLDSGAARIGPAQAFKAENPRFGALTLHRPSNVDDEVTFRRLAMALRELSRDLPLVFPVHPRTRANIERFGIELGERVCLLPPLGYMDFLELWKDAALVLTDSGGLQEETTALGIPCLTLRDNTERPITIEQGTNVLAGTDPMLILAEARKILAGHGKPGRRPDLWDGHAADRIVDVLCNGLAGTR